MKFSIKATNLELTPDISSHIEKTINSLNKFIESTDSSIQAWVEVGRISQHHKSGKIYQSKIQIRLLRNELQQELKQYKNKRITKQRKESPKT